MYVTLEPCPMCAGAIVGARVKKLYFGAYEPKSGSAESRFSVLTESGLNHVTEYEGGVLGAQCSELLKTILKRREKRNSLTILNIYRKISISEKYTRLTGAKLRGLTKNDNTR